MSLVSIRPAGVGLSTMVVFLLLSHFMSCSACADALGAASRPTTQPLTLTAVELLQEIPDIENRQNDKDVYIIQGKIIEGSASISVQAYIGTSGRYAFELSDASNNAPFFWGLKDKAILYDPIGNYIVYADGMCGTFHLDANQTNLNLGWGVDSMGDFVLGGACRFDFSTFFSGVGQMDAKKMAQDRFLLSGITKHGYVVSAIVDRHRTPAIISLSVKKGENDGMMFSISKKAVVDEDTLYKFPTKADLEKKMPVRDWTSLKKSERDRVKLGMIVFVVRRAFKEPDIQRGVDQAFGKQDWDALRRQDHENSEKLRSLWSTVDIYQGKR